MKIWGGAYHHLGGTRMGINKFDSVVNKDLKVHGINNLYVSGSSNFVTSGYTNPTCDKACRRNKQKITYLNYILYLWHIKYTNFYTKKLQNRMKKKRKYFQCYLRALIKIN